MSRGKSTAGKQHSRALSYAHGTPGTAPERGEHTALRNGQLLAPATQTGVQMSPFIIQVCSWEALLDLQITPKADEQLQRVFNQLHLDIQLSFLSETEAEA